MLYDNYGSVFPDFQTFCHFYNFICGEKHTAMVIILNQGNRTIPESVFYYKPMVLDSKPQRLCHPLLWKHAEERTDERKLEHLALLSCCSADDR